MSYGLIYTVPFATLDNIPCVVEIEKDGYEGAPTELTPGATPFIIDINSEEFLYIPTRFSTAKLQIVGSDYLQSLFSTAYREYRVTLIKDGVITWCGFIKPELYTQDYTSEKFILEIECMSAMSVLEFIDYTIEGENKDFVSLWRLLQRCISTATGRYTSVYIPHVYASGKAAYSTGENVLADMTLCEQDFFDEDDKPMKLKEVLEEVCKFFNWTCADWKGSLYFVDVDHSGEYYKYNAMMTSHVDARINELPVQDIGFAGGNHSLDVLPGFNKVTVKCNNYPITSNLFEDIDYEKAELIATSKEYKEGQNPDQCIIKEYRKSDGLDFKLLKVNSSGSIEDVYMDNYKDKPNELNDLLGVRLVRTCSFNPQDSEVSEYTFEDSIQVRMKDKTHDLTELVPKDHIYPVLSLKNKIARVYPPGVFCLTGSSMPFFDNEEMSMLEQEDVSENRVGVLSLRVGDKYYGLFRFTDGSGITWWGKSERYFSPIRLNGNGFISYKNNKTPDMPYKGLKGVILNIDQTLKGDIELMICAGKEAESSPKSLYGYYLKDLKIVYQKPDDVEREEANDSDRIYENVLNESYINEMDEIEFKISSYNNDGACYSKVMLGDDYLKDNLYNCILDDTIRPEEMMITRCINHYSATRIKLTQEIRERADLSPITRLSDTFLVDKKFINAGGTIDCKMNRFECIMIEV